MAAGGAAIGGPADLTCRGVVARPGGGDVLAGVDLHVPAGSLTTLTGPSGVGKTTLLRAIAGFQPLDAGTIRLGDRDLGDVPTHRRGIAYVFQRPRLLPHMDVRANVAFPLRMHGTPRELRDRRAGELLEEVGLGGFGGRSPRDLSGGEAQRVALARALVGEPEMLLLDEPLASVDRDLRRSLRALVQRLLRERPTTALYVTHDQSEAAELGDRVAVLLAGRIAQEGRPDDVFERPVDVEVARFFGTPNVIRGQVAQGELEVGGTPIAVPGADGPAAFVIRPQHVRLDPTSPVRGTIVDRRYLGTHDRLSIHVGSVALELELGPGTAPPPGAEVGVRLPVERLWRIPSDGSVPAPSPATTPP